MPKGLLIFAFILFISLPLLAQEPATDSTCVLNEIVVQAFEHGRPVKDIPAAVSVFEKKDFDRYNNTSILPVLNTAPGVRMEERSPGSYRLSIRGSSLRSPFGVRNVKVYLNGLPLTDPGGNTYLNLLDFSMVGQAEVIKGPSGSLYGAGTGGVLLLKTNAAKYTTQQVQLGTTVGSFGMKRFNIGLQNSSEKLNTTIQYAHQQADGYRQQSKMARDFFLIQENVIVNDNQVISVNAFYADLYYQTPGALTKIQYDTLPSQARPAAGPNRGAVEQKAGVSNQTIYSALTHEYTLGKRWLNKAGVYGAFTTFENPTIRNYERKTEQSFGARTVTEFSGEDLKLNFGGEYQHGFTPTRTYDNNRGEIGTLQKDDELKAVSALVFAQVDLSLPHDFFLTVGGSYNFYKIGFNHRSSTAPLNLHRNFEPVLLPRIALLKKLSPSISVYGSFSKGFSPPTVEELYPSTGVFDQTLKAEKGNNYEGGVKGNVQNNTVQFTLTYYIFQLQQTIVSRRDTTLVGDPEYFINAGHTSQKGLEANAAWTPVLPKNSFIKDVKLWGSYALNHYRFKNYIRDASNYSGNKVTGTPPTTFVAGLDLLLRKGVYANVTLNYTDHIPLTDSNSTYAKPYMLVGARLGYHFSFSSNFPLAIFCGVDNVLNVKYSLGNDLNATGNRFYNAAAPQNFYVGLKSDLTIKKK